MLSLKVAIGLLLVVCLVGGAIKLLLHRRLEEIDGMHEVHEHSAHIDSIGL